MFPVLEAAHCRIARLALLLVVLCALAWCVLAPMMRGCALRHQAESVAARNWWTRKEELTHSSRIPQLRLQRTS
jgi:hypothetical protein